MGGKGKFDCQHCGGSGKFRDARCRACQRLRAGPRRPNFAPKAQPCPEEGFSIKPVSAAELSQLRKFWDERVEGQQPISVCEAWSVENPLLAWRFERKRAEIRTNLGRDPDELKGFHGSAEQNMLSIMSNGFDSSRRCGQAFGAGEYFAKNPTVSVMYCRGGRFMLVCRLVLGNQSTDTNLQDGDHIWVDCCKYYVIAAPDQVLPLYLVRWADDGDKNKEPTTTNEELLAVLKAPGGWSSIAKVVKTEVPKNRPCYMTAEQTDALWVGYLRPDLDDDQLERDLKAFLAANDVKHTRLQVVRGKYTQAKVRLENSLTRKAVQHLNRAAFIESGVERTVTVDDAHGSTGQKCPRSVARYCRGRNLRFVDPCWCAHEMSPTADAAYHMETLDLHSAKGDEICSKFLSSAPFHNGNPKVIALHSIQNHHLQQLHEFYRAYLRDKNGEESKSVDLYHGTNNNIHDEVFTHGLFPPSDTMPGATCPKSGGIGLSTSLCDNTCRHCVEKHEWNKCHMFGLGIYLGDLAQKSHRYVSQPEVRDGKAVYRMILCSVLMGQPLQLEAHLAKPDAMHDMQSLRACYPGDLDRAVEFETSAKKSWPPKLPVEQHDLLFVKGLQGCCRPGSSVFNSEYISFHPYQCLPRYEIVYTMS